MAELDLMTCERRFVGEDPRRSVRTCILIRPVKLIADGAEYFCLIRDISDIGVSLRSFHVFPDVDAAKLELQTGEIVEVNRIWSSDFRAGFAFVNRIDVDAFISELGSFPKRPLRFGTRTRVKLFRQGSPMRGTFLNLSQQGAKLRSNEQLAIGELVRVESDTLPNLLAKVCWRNGKHHGLVFENRFTMPDFAAIAANLQKPCAAFALA